MHARAAAALIALASAGAVGAADVAAGARLYMQLPSGAAGCIGCHGPDPSQSRNNILQAAGRPQALIRAINTVAAMGVLRQAFGEAEAEDVAAYLDQVRAAAPAPFQAWPPTLAMGVMAIGAATPFQTVRLVQQADQALELHVVSLVGEGFALRNDCPRVLPPRATCALALTAATGVAGHRSAALRIDSSAGIRWVGVSANVQGSGAVGVLEIEPSGPVLDFGVHVVGTVAVRDIALINRGTAAVTVEPANITGPQGNRFHVDDFCTERGPIEPGGRCVVRINWSSLQAGESVAAVHWRSSGQSAPPLHLRAAAAPNHKRRLPPAPTRAGSLR